MDHLVSTFQLLAACRGLGGCGFDGAIRLCEEFYRGETKARQEVSYLALLNY